MLMKAPTLATERLTLRALTVDDFDAYFAIWRDETVVRFIGGAPLSAEAAWTRLLRTAGHWQLIGFGFWGIIERESGRLIGEAGFLSLKRDILPTLEGTLETGWCLLPEFHGKGYAIEAVETAMALAESTLPVTDFTCIISPENTPSIRVAEKLGFREHVRTTYSGKPTIIFRKSKVMLA